MDMAGTPPILSSLNLTCHAPHLCTLKVGKRASTKATYPGLLDVLAAGGQPSGLTFRSGRAMRVCI